MAASSRLTEEKEIDMKADEYVKRTGFLPHEENGLFKLMHYEAEEGRRPASGSIYFYAYPDRRTLFHTIDCDEYWVYNLGTPLEIWVVDTKGELEICRLGPNEGEEMIHFFPKGCIFGSKHSAGAEDGTLITCITVPRYMENRSNRLFSDEEVLALYPCLKDFWSD